MAWYWIIAIVIGALFVLSFLIYITNADMKLVEKIYNKLIAFHDGKDVDEKL
ncbi:MAG: hypothetical protein QMB62_06155 [Oscillospiraceae bacterium]